MNAPLRLDYAPRTLVNETWLRRWWRTVWSFGPLTSRPSLLTLALFLACCGATWWLAYRPEPWQFVKTFWIGQSNGSYPNVQYLSKLDAIASNRSGGGLHIWRPWTGEELKQLEVPPEALPPNPPPGRRGEVWWLEKSADESKILGKSEIGHYVWDVASGKIVAQWPAPQPAWSPTPTTKPSKAWPMPLGPTRNDLGDDAARQPYFALGGLSPDGLRLCLINERMELLLYDITARPARLLARKQLDVPLPQNITPDIADYRVTFSPDSRWVMLTGPSSVWIGDSVALNEHLSVRPTYVMDVAFLQGGDKLLMVNGGYGWGRRGLLMYDVPAGKLARLWEMDEMEQPYTLALSPDERRAIVGSTHGVGVAVDLAVPEDRVWPVLQPDPDYGRGTMLPDGRRMIASMLWHYHPGIVDTVTGRHVANLVTPPPGWSGVSGIASRDGKHIAMVHGGTGLQLFEHVGAESPWGLLATRQFAALVACIALLLASLWRDAVRTRRRWQRPDLPRRRVLLAGVLVMIGAGPLVCPFVWCAIGRDVILDPSVWGPYGGWLIWVLLANLFAGLGLLVGSRAWTVGTALLLAATLAIAAVPSWGRAEFVGHSLHVFDRMWLPPPTLVPRIFNTWAIFSALALLALLWPARATINAGWRSVVADGA